MLVCGQALLCLRGRLRFVETLMIDGSSLAARRAQSARVVEVDVRCDRVVRLGARVLSVA
jgi:hypothetical protein